MFKKFAVIILGVLLFNTLFAIEDKLKENKIVISANDQQALIYMREEEKLARDVYIVLGDKWGLRIFQNIAKSEQIHTDMVKNLILGYGIADPVVNDSIGKFTDDKLQKLFSELVEKGSKSKVDALLTGAKIEDLDIYDLNEYLLKVKDAKIKDVFKKLRLGSENHMRAFSNWLRKEDTKYEVEFISNKEYKDILEAKKIKKK
ncbi:MAG: DUF2202 domain-containing protein [Candidatus Delongbacteria bacterium]|jgi:hypothetical protein|nr:DUF2202 domain-containing protein [Candidatus Delongbacteria bacterium]